MKMEMGGIVDKKDSLQQDCGVIELTNINGSFNPQKDYEFLRIRGHQMRIMISWFEKFKIGDSIQINSYEDKIIIFRNVKKIDSLKLSKTLLYRKAPVHFQAKSILDFEE